MRPSSVHLFHLTVTIGKGKAGDKTAPPLIVSKDQLKTIREQTEKGQKSDAIVMGKDELERIKAST